MTKYYQLKDFEIEQWSFLCDHPRNKDYVILINMWSERPERFYKKDFEEMSTSYEEAVEQLIQRLNARIKYYKTDDNKEQ